MKKPKEAKLLVVETGHEARNVLDEVRQHHPDLKDANIELLWILSPKTRKGKRVLGTCQVAPEKLYRLAGVDIVIELDHEFWQRADDLAKRYLVDHELCHAAPKLDEHGHQEFDETGRHLWASVAHDIEDFAAPIARYGVPPDLHSFLESAQMPLPGVEMMPWRKGPDVHGQRVN